MTDIFENILEASFHGSIVILAVILLRFLLKKTPKKYLCLLWLLAGIRLLMPFEIQSGLSLQPDVESIRESAIVEDVPDFLPDHLAEVPVQTNFNDAEDNLIPDDVPMEVIISGEMAVQSPAEEPAEEDPLLRLDKIAANIWATVAFCFGLYTIGSYLRLKLQVREAIRLRGNVWECDRIETAFILGFIRPQIYLPMGMSRNNRRHILAHERTHLEKGDHWIKMIGFIALSLHWFNPLVWVAYWLLCKDIEMACDERVVQFMELEERKSYSAALLNCSTNHAHFAACPVAFGEVSVKNRVLSVLNYRKPSFWISLLGVIAIAFVAVCLVTSPTEEPLPLAADGAPEGTEAALDVVKVSTVDELLAAIGPDAEIQMEPGTYNLGEAANYGKDTGNEYYSWIQEYDGYALTLTNVENLTIRGSGMHLTLVETDPRYVDVIAMENCRNVELSDFTAGHTRNRGECTGGVVQLRSCAGIDLQSMGLYGCGVVGLTTLGGENISLIDSDIYECSSSAANLQDTNGITISGCRIYSIGREEYDGYVYFDITRCQNVTVESCELSDSSLQNLMILSDSQVSLRNNFFTRNRVQDGAFTVWGQDVTLEGSKFEDNSIRNWYSTHDANLVDGSGRVLTEEDLLGQYGTEPTEPGNPQLEIHVSTVDEFLAAIGSNKEIVLEAELYDLSTATGYGTSKGDYYRWEDIFDGPGLVIQNVSNMTIRSKDGNRNACTISAVPRYADVLAFQACSNITVSGFTAGHTREPGSCAGGVLEFRDCDVMTVDNCGLFGCGILGVQADNGSDITVKNCEIYECSQGGISMSNVSGVSVEKTTFRDIGGDNYMRFGGCKRVTVDGKEVIPSSGGSLSISTPEQEERQKLEYAVYVFLDCFTGGEQEEMKGCLASAYVGDAAVWEENSEMKGYHGFYADMAQVEEIRQKGSYTFELELYVWDPVANKDGKTIPMSVTVVKENGEFKISDYQLQ